MLGGRASGDSGRFSVASARSIRRSVDLYGTPLLSTQYPGTIAPAAAAAAGSGMPAASSARSGSASFSFGASPGASLPSPGAFVSQTADGVAGGQSTPPSAAATLGNEQAPVDAEYKPFERRLSASLVWRLRAELELKKVRAGMLDVLRGGLPGTAGVRLKGGGQRCMRRV